MRLPLSNSPVEFELQLFRRRVTTYPFRLARDRVITLTVCETAEAAVSLIFGPFANNIIIIIT